VEAPAIFEETAPTNWTKKKMIDGGDITMDATRM
jgi:hypothetical protein